MAKAVMRYTGSEEELRATGCRLVMAGPLGFVYKWAPEEKRLGAYAFFYFPQRTVKCETGMMSIQAFLLQSGLYQMITEGTVSIDMTEEGA